MSVVKKLKNMMQKIRTNRARGKPTRGDEKKLINVIKKTGGGIKFRKVFGVANPPGSKLKRKLKRRAQGYGSKCFI